MGVERQRAGTGHQKARLAPNKPKQGSRGDLGTDNIRGARPRNGPYQTPVQGRAGTPQGYIALPQ
jgi:hypothetical protein